ncbi:hypothetical protein L565_2059 [Bordetella pertussis CHLA-20]|nr:hypothetical protein L565_2059 [Bordetella pertussis CHLA-20]
MYAWFIRTGFEKRCTHLQTQPGRIQPIDSSHLGDRVIPYGRKVSGRP